MTLNISNNTPKPNSLKTQLQYLPLDPLQPPLPIPPQLLHLALDLPIIFFTSNILFHQLIIVILLLLILLLQNRVLLLKVGGGVFEGGQLLGQFLVLLFQRLGCCQALEQFVFHCFIVFLFVFTVFVVFICFQYFFQFFFVLLYFYLSYYIINTSSSFIQVYFIFFFNQFISSCLAFSSVCQLFIVIRRFFRSSIQFCSFFASFWGQLFILFTNYVSSF